MFKWFWGHISIDASDLSAYSHKKVSMSAAIKEIGKLFPLFKKPSRSFRPVTSISSNNFYTYTKQNLSDCILQLNPIKP